MKNDFFNNFQGCKRINVNIMKINGTNFMRVEYLNKAILTYFMQIWPKNLKIDHDCEIYISLDEILKK